MITSQDDKQPLELLRSAAFNMMTAAFSFESGDLTEQMHYADYRLALADKTPYEVEHLLQPFREQDSDTFIFRNAILRFSKTYTSIFEQDKHTATVILRSKYVLVVVRVEQPTED